MAWLVLIETSGNQDFIFATNKLRDNVGASELIHRIGTSFVLSAVAETAKAYEDLAEKLERAYRVLEVVDGRRRYAGPAIPTSTYVRELAGIARDNPLGPGNRVEVVVATSGKAVLLVDDRETGKRIIERVTLQALRDAPGAVVRGIVDSQNVSLDVGRDVAHARMKAIHEALAALRRDLPAPEARFPSLPIVAPCATSGLPAEHRDADGYMSAPVRAKREAAYAGWRRVQASLGKIGETLSRNVARLDENNLAWYGVVHADGNGFGKVFLNLADCAPADRVTARDYFGFYRDLSLALEMAGTAALRKAAEAFKAALLRDGVAIDPAKKKYLPLVPLVFGGDDVTVICDGSRAVTFAETYLKAFEEATAAGKIEMSADGKTETFDSVIPALLDPKAPPDARGKKDGFGGGAGIAVIKPHHPFHRAYDLAEELAKSAKISKTRLGTDAISALDFQVVYLDAASDLSKHRKAWTRGGTRLHARPYVVSDEQRLAFAKEKRNWADSHHLASLRRAMAALKDSGDDKQDDDRRTLPRSQQHALRGALFMDLSDGRLDLVRERYQLVDWAAFGESRANLFFSDGDETRRTRLLDAMELIDVGESPDRHAGHGDAREVEE